MNEDFRQRVFLPVMLPIGAVIGFFGFAFMLSRVLLAVEEMAATALALGLAAYILAVAAIVSTKPRITSRALAVGVSLGLVSVVVAGAIAASVGMRELEHGAGVAQGEEGAEGASAAEGEPPDAAAADETQLQFVAVDIEFDQAPESTTAGEKQIVLVNDGNAPHNVTLPDVQEEPIVETTGGETAEGTVTLDPGSYEFFCSVPGHEDLMRGELTVE